MMAPESSFLLSGFYSAFPRGTPAIARLVLRGIAGIAILACTSLLGGAQTKETSASTPPSSPQVVVVVHVPSSNLSITEMKYRVMYWKQETKTIPLNNFDFVGNISDSLLTALSEDKRARWAPPKPEDRVHFDPYFAPKVKPAEVKLPASVEGDRVLLVWCTFGALVHTMYKWLQVQGGVQMVDRATGRVMWKKGLFEKMTLPATMEALQAEDQKGLKEALNKLMEQMAVKIKQHAAKSQI